MTVEIPLSLDPPAGWVLAGHGAFHRAGPGVIESRGGPGIPWYTPRDFGDFALSIEWRLSSPTDNSGVFVRIPRLGPTTPSRTGSRPWHAATKFRSTTGASTTTPAPRRARSIGRARSTRAPRRPCARRRRPWNTFAIEARDTTIAVTLNGTRVSRVDDAQGPRRGYVGLQAHDERSRVQFRNLRIAVADGE